MKKGNIVLSPQKYLYHVENNEQNLRGVTLKQNKKNNIGIPISRNKLKNYEKVAIGNSLYFENNKNQPFTFKLNNKNNPVLYSHRNRKNINLKKEKVINHNSTKNFYGGKKAYTGEYRHFKLDTVNGQPVKFEALANIKDHQTPLSAAKKLLRSYCRAKGLKESNRLKLNVKFTIRETTRGHSKVFGPYSGKYHKYTAEEMKKAKASGVVFHMKPVVKLSK